MKYLAFIVALMCAFPVQAAEKLTVMLDWFVNPDHGPIIIAQEKGYFADAGLDVKIIAPADPADPPKMVAAGTVDLGVSYQPLLHMQIHEGMPLVRVGTLVATPLNCLLVLADGPVKTPKDMAGRKIGYSIPGFESALVSTILSKYGVDVSEIEMINVNWSLSPALMAGNVDAVIGAYRNFELHQMNLEGVKGHCFYVEEEGVPAYDELVYVANAKTMDKDRIIAFLHATERATQFIVNHPQESWQIFASTSTELNDELNKLAWGDTYPRFALRPAALDVGRYRDFEAFMLKEGLVDTEFPVKKIARDLSEE